MTPTPPRFTPITEKALRLAGWEPGRLATTEQLESWLIIDLHPNEQVPLGHLRMFPAAFRVLREFGGLTIELGRLEVSPAAEPFVIDPLLAGLCNEKIAMWHHYEWELGTPLFPLGLVRSGDGGNMGTRYVPTETDNVLMIAVDGRVFLWGSQSMFLGKTIEVALEQLVTLKKPWQALVTDCREHICNEDDFGLVRKMMNLIEAREIDSYLAQGKAIYR